jgi:hypothetical protein
MNCHQLGSTGAAAHRLTRLCRFALISFTLAGCSRGPERAEVEGVVTLAGKPLANVEVVFMPDPELGSTGPRAVALTDAEGYYHLGADAGQEGAAVGKYRVLLVDNEARSRTPRPDPGPDEDRPQVGKAQAPKSGAEKSRVPPRYGRVDATPLQPIEVKSGKQRHDFQINAEGSRGTK